MFLLFPALSLWISEKHSSLWLKAWHELHPIEYYPRRKDLLLVTRFPFSKISAWMWNSQTRSFSFPQISSNWKNREVPHLQLTLSTLPSSTANLPVESIWSVESRATRTLQKSIILTFSSNFSRKAYLPKEVRIDDVSCRQLYYY